MVKKRSIAILTGGGDCPGMNAVVRAAAKKAILECGQDVIGIEDGYDGVIHGRYRRLQYDDVSGIITSGGTILGISNTANPYRAAVRRGDGLDYEDVSQQAIANIESMGVSCLVCVGSDGTLSIAARLSRDGVPIVGVPKTIDNDLRGTDITVGFHSAVCILPRKPLTGYTPQHNPTTVLWLWKSWGVTRGGLPCLRASPAEVMSYSFRRFPMRWRWSRRR